MAQTEQSSALLAGRGRRKSGKAARNRLVGIFVPLLLLAYVAFAYFIVVTQYSYQYLYLENHASAHPTLTSLWFILIHILLLATFVHYIKVFRGPSSPSLPQDPPESIQRKRIIFESDQDGNPLRCWRDNCKGRWKPPRTRHCGTCGTCRPGFDHHCVWFNADVTAPDTIQSFLLTCFLAPILLIAALAPLWPICWKHATLIWASARSNPAVHRLWWRAWLYPKHAAPVMQTDSDWLARPTIGTILLFFCGAAISLVCIGLLSTTLALLAKADLTVDVARRRTSARLSQNNPTPRDQSSSPPTSTIHHPLGVNFFWVPLPHAHSAGQRIDDDDGTAVSAGVVIPCHPDEQPYSAENWKQNLRIMLGLSPFDRLDRMTSWPISKSWVSTLQERAVNIASQQQASQSTSP
ncbi:unnamed protein product [Tilletia controversa]|uniref:Palmitoyltransferase n=1 Tax=Tilletia caries TaxID=13290 RepID=A0ABN7J7B5_9BASI|nr:unnamed protein product [Tilletia controversa]CAD6953190.1 unnamed protein product [Tilletia caries]CAD7059806.1 unnamed protein product [Tilletia caries]